MAICACGAEGTRIRSRWNGKGERLPDECPKCHPESFEKFTAPSDKKIWMGYEAHPNEYVKSADGGYDRKPEYRAEQEQRLRSETEDERTARLAAEEKKRSERRKEPMDSVELAQAIRIASMYADALQEGQLS
jgi:hypothetical protein